VRHRKAHHTAATALPASSAALDFIKPQVAKIPQRQQLARRHEAHRSAAAARQFKSRGMIEVA
jgi:hypothetical protein